MKDMSATQYRAALARWNFNAAGFGGYYELPTRSKLTVSVFNAGFHSTRRARLAFLIVAYEAEIAREEKQAIEELINAS